MGWFFSSEFKTGVKGGKNSHSGGDFLLFRGVIGGVSAPRLERSLPPPRCPPSIRRRLRTLPSRLRPWTLPLHKEFREAGPLVSSLRSGTLRPGLKELLTSREAT